VRSECKIICEHLYLQQSVCGERSGDRHIHVTEQAIDSVDDRVHSPAAEQEHVSHCNMNTHTSQHTRAHTHTRARTHTHITTCLYHTDQHNTPCTVYLQLIPINNLYMFLAGSLLITRRCCAAYTAVGMCHAFHCDTLAASRHKCMTYTKCCIHRAVLCWSV
jgi:hypothetical protein